MNHQKINENRKPKSDFGSRLSEVGLKLFKQKRGVNDISIAWGIITIFILIGVLMPYINDAFDTDTGVPNIGGLEENVGEDAENVSTLNAFTILFSVLKMFFWTFGDLPFWLDSIFIIFSRFLMTAFALHERIPYSLRSTAK